MYGRHFECMYTGSMIGAGAVAFAIMGYVIATRRGEFVELNPKLLAFTLGETEESISDAIKFLCSPDKRSRSKKEEGRRLIYQGGFTYKVVNATHYDAIHQAIERLDRDKVRKAEERAEKKRMEAEMKKEQKDNARNAEPEQDDNVSWSGRKLK